MATELIDGVWQFALPRVNAYLFEDGDEVVLVDAGTPRDADRVREGVRDAGFAVREIDRVLLTHYDVDHAGGLARLAPPLDAPVYAGEPDAGVVAGRHRPSWRSRKGALQRLLGRFDASPDLPVQSVWDGDEIGSVTAYHTPGHTPGHMAYVSERHDAAFVGDLVVARGDRLIPSPWFLSDDVEEVNESIRSFVERAPDFEVLCPGHGAPLVLNGSAVLAALARDDGPEADRGARA